MWAARADGSHLRQLSPSDGASYYPVPVRSSAGRVLALATEGGESQAHREYLVELSGRRTAVPRSFDSMHLRAPSLSPDGAFAVVESDRDSFRDIFRIDLQSGAASRLTREKNGAFEPALSPDGSRIAFVFNPRRQSRDLHDGRRRRAPGPADGVLPRGHDPALVPRRQPDHVRQRARGRRPAVRHGRRRQRPAAADHTPPATPTRARRSGPPTAAGSPTWSVAMVSRRSGWSTSPVARRGGSRTPAPRTITRAGRPTAAGWRSSTGPGATVVIRGTARGRPDAHAVGSVRPAAAPRWRP